MNRVGRMILGLTAGFALAMAPVGAAVAAPTAQDVEVSLDGVNFSSTPSGSLFAGVAPLVPGGSAQRTLWVRNDGPATVVMRINATDVTVADPLYAASLSLTAGTSTGRSMLFSTTEQCSLLVGEQYLGPHQVVAVTFDVALSDRLTGTDAQLRSAAADLVVGMRDASAPAPADGACDGLHLPVLGGETTSSATRLSTTGAEPFPWLLMAGALLVGGSLATFTGRKRRRESERKSGA